MKLKALFLDRDGVINSDYGHVFKKEDIKFIEGIFDLVRDAKKKGYVVIIITNQAGIAKKIFSEEEFTNLMKWMLSQFHIRNAIIDDYFYCPYHPEFQDLKYKNYKYDRKPYPGMLLKAKCKYNIDMQKSIFIGDKLTDMIAGEKAKLGKLIYFNQNRVQEYTTIDNHYEIKKLI